jgi:hypothetical protein
MDPYQPLKAKIVLTFYHQILFAYEDERGENVVEALDFWKSQRRSEVYNGAPAPAPDKSVASLQSLPGHHSRFGQ